MRTNQTWENEVKYLQETLAELACIVIVTLVASGCSSDVIDLSNEDSSHSVGSNVSQNMEKQDSMDVAGESLEPSPTPGYDDDDVARLFATMDEVAPERQAHYRGEEQKFLQHPDAINLLRERHASSAAGDYNGRWRTIYLASKVHTSDAVDFLVGVALAPLTERHGPNAPDAHESHDCDPESDFPARFRAAVGIIQSLAKGVPGSGAAVIRLLAEGDPAVARMTIAELAGEGGLGREHVAIAKRRGFRADFRMLSEEERQRVTTIHPATLQRQDGKPMIKAPLPAY